jgi:GT2 family glycosyltransferase
MEAGAASGPWYVIVLSWNDREETLPSLRAALSIPRDDVTVVCVDNGSTDGSPEAIAEELPEVTLLRSDVNLGFAGGNNVGVRHALEQGAGWVVLLNNDATIAPDAIDGFEAAAAQRPDAGVLAGKVFYDEPPDRIWFAGQRFRPVLGYSGRPRGYGKTDGPAYDEVVDTDRAVGALMAVSRPTLERVGLMDDDLFIYVEDVDWCLRARAAGFGVVFAPAARAWHRISASSGGEQVSTSTLYYGVRNTIVVTERHRPLGSLGNRLRRALILASFGAYALTRGNPREALAAMREGHRDAQTGKLGRRGA